ncbi:MFS general substrate transporter [Schizophyllum commune Tattone D]|nr:MFS general substrate transporter [Schizophyllum commune Tattone D]
MAKDELNLSREPSIEDQATRLSFKKLLIIFLGLGSAIFLSFLDTTSVTTALPKIATDIHAGQSITWVGTSYLVATTSFQIIYGRLSDIFGRKALLMSALFIFAVGDLLCGFAKTPVQLYVFRAIAGIGGGGIGTLSMIVMSDVTSLRERGKWQGYIAGSVALGSAVGPFVGAALAQQASWRYVFWLPVPCTVISAIIIYLYIPLKAVSGNYHEKLWKIDYLGSFLSLAGNIFLLVPISAGGSTFPWNSGVVIGLLCAGGVVWGLFALVEWKFCRLPVMPLRLFTYRTTCLVFCMNLFYGMVYYGNIYFLPIYYQKFRGFSELKSAALLLPLLLIQSVSGVLNGQVTMYTGGVKPQILVGFSLWLIGSGLQSTFKRATSIGKIVGILLVQGIGTGGILQTTLVAAQAAAPGKDRAVVTGTRNFFRTMGGAFGVAISNAILNNIISDELPAALPSDIRDSLLAGGSIDLPSSLPSDVAEGVYAAFEHGLHMVYVYYIPLIAVCLIMSLFLKDFGLPDVMAEKVAAGAITPAITEPPTAVPSTTDLTIEPKTPAGLESGLTTAAPSIKEKFESIEKEVPIESTNRRLPEDRV